MNDTITKKVTDILKTKYQDNSNTYKTYLRNFKKIHILLGNKKTFKEYKNVENVVKIINDNIEKNTSKKMIYVSLSIILSNVKGFKKKSKEYKDFNYKLTKNINEQLIKNEKTDKQENKLVDYIDLINKVKDIRKNKDKIGYKNYMLCFMYVVPIFTPRNEYINLSVFYDKKDIDNNKNYILVEKDEITIVLNKYKTFKHFGKIEYTYDKRVQKEIKNYLESLNNPDMLFKMNRQNLHKQLTKYLGVSVQFIRTIKNDWYIKQKKFRDMNNEEQKNNLIKLFQHDIQESFTSYRKNDLN